MHESGIKVSVIIPVYNAAEFLERAVLSALELSQTAEVLLVEDGSKDDSMNICKTLEKTHAKVKLLTHPGNRNKGAGQSRNLGIENATSAFVAFLDADDIYLPNRFDAEEKILPSNPNIDGVYGALGVQFFSEQGRLDFNRVEGGELTTTNRKVEPEELKWVLLDLIQGVGFFSIDTLTIKKKALSRSGLFPGIKYHEDTIFIIKLAFNSILVGGIIDRPIGVRGVHDNNTITKNENPVQTRLIMYAELLHWAKHSNQPKEFIRMLKAKRVTFETADGARVKRLFVFLKEMVVNPLFRRYTLFFNPAAVNVLGYDFGHIVIKMKEFLLKRVLKQDSSNHAFFEFLRSIESKLKMSEHAKTH